VADLPSGERFFTTREVAELLGVTAPTVISWVKKGRLDAHTTPGGHRRIPSASLSRFAEECGHNIEGLDKVDSGGEDHETRVLVVDNETDFAEMVAEFFNLHEGVSARYAVEPVEVGYQLGAFSPHVVLCAADVPGVSPKLVAKVVTQTNARMVLLCGLKTARDESLGQELGVHAIVEKAIKLEALLKIIRG
jgi:excisionase family DNA binding protein